MPYQTPARMRFSAFILISGGKLEIAKRIGQNDCLDDLNSWTTSQQRMKPKCSGTDKKPPPLLKSLYTLPSCKS